MKVQEFLDHHGIAHNPFAEEDAQTDPVFKQHCIASTRHPTWDKIYGDPADPSTSIVFGEKGAGKTALRLQIDRELHDYNRAHRDAQLYVIHYDDFNPYLDRFRDRLGRFRQRADKVLAQWRLWDHMDAILSLGVTNLVDRILEVRQPSDRAGAEIDLTRVREFDRHQARDLLLLAACYDQSTSETVQGRWNRLRKKLGFWSFDIYWPIGVGIAGTALTLFLVIALAVNVRWEWLQHVWIYLLLILATWLPWLIRATRSFKQAWGIAKHTRALNHQVGPLRQVLQYFTPAELAGQPLPNKNRTDDRYELLAKFQGILNSLGFSGIIVLVDRVDEPHLINGSAEMMRDLLWPMLDNKFLKQPGIGFKLLLPVEVSRFIEREERDFYQRARLDKQNMIPSLQWTGEALFDVANARVQACAAEGKKPNLRDMFDDSVTDDRLIEAIRSLRVPRHLFKFLYRLIVTHCNAFTNQAPRWKISSEMFESVLAVYRRDQDAFDRGVGAG